MRRRTFGYDNRNRTTSTTDVFGHTINYEYERTSAVNQKRLKFDGAMYAVYNFDDAERLSNIVNSADSTTIGFGYDDEDKVTSRTYPNGVTTSYQYFDNLRLSAAKFFLSFEWNLGVLKHTKFIAGDFLEKLRIVEHLDEAVDGRVP